MVPFHVEGHKLEYKYDTNTLDALKTFVWWPYCTSSEKFSNSTTVTTHWSWSAFENSNHSSSLYSWGTKSKLSEKVVKIGMLWLENFLIGRSLCFLLRHGKFFCACRKCTADSHHNVYAHFHMEHQIIMYFSCALSAPFTLLQSVTYKIHIKILFCKVLSI